MTLLFIGFVVCVILLVLLMHHPEKCCCEKELKKIEHQLNRVLALLHRQTGFTTHQLIEGEFMAITGIVAGQVGTFKETPLPVGAVIPPGTIPQWTTSDTTNTALTPSADGTSVAVAVAAGTTISTFNLSVANQDGSFLTTVPVPVLPVAPPPQTGFQIDQTS